MTITEKLRAAVSAPGGRERYAKVISEAQAAGIKAYQNGLASGIPKKVARIMGEQARDEALLILLAEVR